jgi:hypothetical protein
VGHDPNRGRHAGGDRLPDGALSDPTFVGTKAGSKVIDRKGSVKEVGERSLYEERGRVGQVYELQIAQAVEFRLSLLIRETLFDYVSNNRLYMLIGGLLLWAANNLILKRAIDIYKKSYGTTDKE